MTWTVARASRRYGYYGIAALELGLKWVGCEVNPETHKFASKRISGADQGGGQAGYPNSCTGEGLKPCVENPKQDKQTTDPGVARWVRMYAVSASLSAQSGRLLAAPSPWKEFRIMPWGI